MSSPSKTSDQTDQSVDLLGTQYLKEFNIKSVQESKLDATTDARESHQANGRSNYDRQTFGDNRTFDADGDDVRPSIQLDNKFAQIEEDDEELFPPGSRDSQYNEDEEAYQTNFILRPSVPSTSQQLEFATQQPSNSKSKIKNSDSNSSVSQKYLDV